MQTYAWREQTPQPDREYRRLHARYLRQMRELMNWMLHLCRKPWITGRTLFDFAELVSHLYGIDTSWNYAVEHSPFAGDWREKGGVK